MTAIESDDQEVETDRTQGRGSGASHTEPRSGKPSQAVTVGLEQGGKKQQTAWRITMSSVSLESKKQGRKSKVEDGELDRVRS